MSNILTEEWLKIIECLKGETTQISFNTWFAPIKPLYIEDNTLFLEVPTEFHRSNLLSRFHDLLKNTVK